MMRGRNVKTKVGFLNYQQPNFKSYSSDTRTVSEEEKSDIRYEKAIRV